jgi:hypothetical protein
VGRDGAVEVTWLSERHVLTTSREDAGRFESSSVVRRKGAPRPSETTSRYRFLRGIERATREQERLVRG